MGQDGAKENAITQVQMPVIRLGKTDLHGLVL
jgi:hypothetical protein